MKFKQLIVMIVMAFTLAWTGGTSPTFAADTSACDAHHDTFVQEGRFDEAQWPWLVKVMYRESRCDHGAVNRRTKDYGLMQVHWQANYTWKNIGWGYGPLGAECGIWSGGQLLDPDTNAKCAFVLYSARGKQPWGK